MPRWLSEGISVHEESLRNPVWGMAMDARFRRMILEDKATTPLSQLSSAFLNASDYQAVVDAERAIYARVVPKLSLGNR
jgi:hypothetical protein